MVVVGITPHVHLCTDQGELAYTSQKKSLFPASLTLNAIYTDFFIAHGAIAIILPPYLEAIDHYINQIDGLIFTGGGFDIDPFLYGQKPLVKNLMLNPVRQSFEMALLEAFMKTQKPILGICAGMQLINVFHKGSLWQDLMMQNKTQKNHSYSDPHLPRHSIDIKKDTLLHRLTGEVVTNINTSHHQAVQDLGKDIVANAVSQDGVIEGIEHSKYPFCLGLQWHIEYGSSPIDTKIGQGFVKACEASKRSENEVK